MAKKKYDIDGEDVEKLASYGCANKEIADFYGCDPSLIGKSYSSFLIKGRAKGKMRLRQMQWKAAEKGATAMLIFLGKNLLGQSDNPNESDNNEPLPFID